MRKLEWIVRIVSSISLLFVGLFFLIGGVWNYFFGTRIGMMLSPLMLLFGGSMIIAGIFIVWKMIH